MPGRGGAYVFTEPGTTWASETQTAKLTASDGTAGSLFGSSVSISGSTALVGAWGANGSKGSAYEFTATGGVWSNMTQTAELTASDGVAGDNFGFAVAISGNTAVVGAPTPRSAAPARRRGCTNLRRPPRVGRT